MDNICARCHKMGLGCCFFKETANNIQIGIFYDDILKIEGFIGQDKNHFIVREEISNNIRESLSKKAHPVFDKIYHKNSSFKLKVVDGQCIFLADSGCKLPEDKRPLYCRIYPFWLSFDNRHINVLSSYDCLAQKKSTLSWAVVNQHFGYSEEYIRELFREIELAGDRHVLNLEYLHSG